jgi:hypothetical protein
MVSVLAKVRGFKSGRQRCLRVFLSDGDTLTGNWRIFHNGELRNFYCFNRYQCDKVEDKEVDKTSSTHGVDEKSIQYYSWNKKRWRPSRPAEQLSSSEDDFRSMLLIKTLNVSEYISEYLTVLTIVPSGNLTRDGNEM